MFSLFCPKKVHLKAKINLFLPFSADTTMSRNFCIVFAHEELIKHPQKYDTLYKLQKFSELPKTAQSA